MEAVGLFQTFCSFVSVRNHCERERPSMYYQYCSFYLPTIYLFLFQVDRMTESVIENALELGLFGRDFLLFSDKLVQLGLQNVDLLFTLFRRFLFGDL